MDPEDEISTNFKVKECSLYLINLLCYERQNRMYTTTLETERSHMLSKFVPYDMYMGLFTSYGNKIREKKHMGTLYPKMFPYVW